VACWFIVTAIQADIACVDVAGGIIPGIPRGIDSALMIAAIMGGAIHITIIGLHTYNTNARQTAIDAIRQLPIRSCVKNTRNFLQFPQSQ